MIKWKKNILLLVFYLQIKSVIDYFMLWSLDEVLETFWKIYEIIFVYFVSNRDEKSNTWY